MAYGVCQCYATHMVWRFVMSVYATMGSMVWRLGASRIFRLKVVAAEGKAPFDRH